MVTDSRPGPPSIIHLAGVFRAGKPAQCEKPRISEGSPAACARAHPTLCRTIRNKKSHTFSGIPRAFRRFCAGRVTWGRCIRPKTTAGPGKWPGRSIRTAGLEAEKMVASRLGAMNRGLDNFVRQMFHRLGASRRVNYCCRDPRGGGIREVQAVFVSCPRQAWVAEFGEPQHVRRQFDAATGGWLRSWEHPSTDGPVCCVGQLFDRSPGTEWVVVSQVSVSRDRMTGGRARS
jgi:hypothetical protein